MAKIPFNFGGGSGNGSDDCTAEAADIVANYTAIYKNTDDEPANGSMTDYSGSTMSGTVGVSSSSNRVELTFNSTGRYSTSSKLYAPYSDTAKTIGLTSSNLVTGNTILGITGGYTGVGDATADQVLSGKKFSTATLSNATGTMTNVDSIDTAKSIALSNGVLTARMTAGAHITNASAGYPSVGIAQGTLASLIGLTASKIVYGNTILGIAGTSVSPGNTEGYDLYAYGQEAITVTVYLSAGSGTGSLSPTSYTGQAMKTSGCIACGVDTNVTYTNVILFSGATINFSNYSTVHVVGRAVTGSFNRTIRACYGSTTSQATSSSYNAADSQDVSFSTNNSTGATEVQLDISGVTGSNYLAIYVYNSTGTRGTIAIEHIWLT